MRSKTHLTRLFPLTITPNKEHPIISIVGGSEQTKRACNRSQLSQNCHWEMVHPAAKKDSPPCSNDEPNNGVITLLTRLIRRNARKTVHRDWLPADKGSRSVPVVFCRIGERGGRLLERLSLWWNVNFSGGNCSEFSKAEISWILGFVVVTRG